MAMTACYPSYELPTQSTVASPSSRTPVVQVPPPQKDYSRPLHVDCSVEYELPNQAKPPQGVRNEPLLMIHPCYFRKIESQRRSPFINNLPGTATRPPSTAPSSKRRTASRTHHNHHHHHHQQQQQQQAPQYPLQYTAIIERYPQQQLIQQPPQQIWEPLPPLVQQQQSCRKRDAIAPVAGIYNNSGGSVDSGHWTDPDRSPDRPEDKHILMGKYRQYLRAHRLHPYVSSSSSTSSAIPIGSTFPQIHQQVCYNV